MAETRSVDQMVEAAIWLMVQGERDGAGELLAQVLKAHPGHEKARQALKVAGAVTSPGTPPAPMPVALQPVIPSAVGRTSQETQVLPQQGWSLSILSGAHQGRSLTLTERPLVVGRNADFDDDTSLAPAHATFFQRAGEVWVCDGGSTSGTWVTVDGGQRLLPGDTFSAGHQRLRYLGPLDTALAHQPKRVGAPRPQGAWRLEQIFEGNRSGRAWVLTGMATVGREGTTLRFPDDKALASLHAELRPSGQFLEVIDKSARAGTFVALPAGTARRLGEHMRVRLGNTVFRASLR